MAFQDKLILLLKNIKLNLMNDIYGCDCLALSGRLFFAVRNPGRRRYAPLPWAVILRAFSPFERTPSARFIFTKCTNSRGAINRAPTQLLSRLQALISGFAEVAIEKQHYFTKFRNQISLCAIS